MDKTENLVGKFLQKRLDNYGCYVSCINKKFNA